MADTSRFDVTARASAGRLVLTGADGVGWAWVAWEVVKVPVVDPDDDSVWRWVLQHYRFDPQRRQRRNVTVAAYDNAAEFEAAFSAHDERIRVEIDAGDRDPREHVGGVIRPPGYHAEQARGRLMRDAIGHGVDPRPLLDDGLLPSNVVVFGWDEDGQHWSAGGGEPPTPPTG